MKDPEREPTERALAESVGDAVFERLRPHARRRRFPKGSLLWREGDETGLLVSLAAGQVKIYRVSPDTGGVVTLFRFGPGTTFGFMPFLDGAPYPATAEALTDVEADVIPGDALPGIFASDPDVALFLVRQLARRLRESMERQAQHRFRGAVPGSPRRCSAWCPQPLRALEDSSSGSPSAPGSSPSTSACNPRRSRVPSRNW